MPEEKIFMQEGGVTVTSTRFSLGKKTYGMANISSVSVERETRSEVGPIILIGIGMFVVIGLYHFIGMIVFGLDVRFIVDLMNALVREFSSLRILLIWSIVFLFSGIIWLLLSRDRYVIYLDTISGTRKALSDPNGLFVAQIARALGEAIVYRG